MRRMRPSPLYTNIEANKQQLRERVKVDRQFIHNHLSSERAVVSFIPPAARTILDLGCGNTGGLLLHIPEMDYIGLDFVHDYLATLRSTQPACGPWGFGTRHWVSSQMETLPFPAGYFDVVYSRHSLEHSTNLLLTLAEIKRVLKPGGIFIFCVPARVDDEEPTHMTRWPARRWLQAFRSIGKLRFHGQHSFFIDELYGYLETSGKPRTNLVVWLKRRSNYLRGQGILPDIVMRMLVRGNQWLSRTLEHARA